jgi:hypothetical protein
MAGYSIGTDEDKRKNLNKPDGYKSSNRWEKKKAPPPISMQIYIIRRRPNTTALFFPPQRWMGRTGCKLCVTDEVLLTIKQGLGRRKIRTVVLVTCCTHKPG